MATIQERHPELFAIDKHVNPRTRKRVLPMEVLALGMSRTGTASMQAALQILGYPTFHGFSIFYNLRDVEMWREGLIAKYFPVSSPIPPFGLQEFDQLLGEYGALCDIPAVCFAPELLVAYPDAKVVLVERDIEPWYKSFNDAVIQPMFDPVTNFVAMLDPWYLGKLNKMMHAVLRTQFRSGSKEELIANARPVYREHYRKVRELAKGRILEFSLKDGWEPLCKFLDRPVPNVLFPRVNDSAAMEEKIKVVGQQAMLRVLRNAAVAFSGSVAVGLAIYWSKRR